MKIYQEKVLIIENEKELAIGKSLETIDLDIESNAQILNHEMAIVNNYTESLKDVEIIGNIATENNDEMYETPVFVHKNPLKAVYLKFGDKTVLIADEQGYIDENWEKFANLHNPKSINDKNDMMIERVNNIKDNFSIHLKVISTYFFKGISYTFELTFETAAFPLTVS